MKRIDSKAAKMFGTNIWNDKFSKPFTDHLGSTGKMKQGNDIQFSVDHIWQLLGLENEGRKHFEFHGKPKLSPWKLYVSTFVKHEQTHPNSKWWYG